MQGDNFKAASAAIKAATAAGTTCDRPDVRAAIIVPERYTGAAEADAYRDGACARMDGIDEAKCPYPYDRQLNPPPGLAGCWLSGWHFGTVGVVRISANSGNPNAGKFQLADAEHATHATHVHSLGASLRGQVPVGVVNLATHRVEGEPGVFGTNVGVTPTPPVYVGQIQHADGRTTQYPIVSGRVSMTPGEYDAMNQSRYDALAAAHEHALRASQSHGFTRHGDEWRLDGAKVVSDAAARITDRERDAAVRTLKAKGYTYHGGTAWKPPLGPPRFELQDVARATLAALRVIARLGRLPSGGEEIGNWAHAQRLAGDLARVLNEPVVIGTPSPEELATVQDALSKPSQGMEWKPGDPPPIGVPGDRMARAPIKPGEQVTLSFDNGVASFVMVAVEPDRRYRLATFRGDDGYSVFADVRDFEGWTWSALTNLFHAIRKAANAGR
jgi:hypothetical protein